MSATVEQMLGAATGQLGKYYSRPNGVSPYGNWYAERVGDSSFKTAPWCAMFLSWCANQVKATDIIPVHAYTPSGVSWFKSRGQWHTRSPKRGDLVYYKFSGPRVHHVGIVEQVHSDGSVTAIEGNTSGTASGSQRNGGVVARKRRKTGIVGFGRPAYSSQQVDTVDIHTTKVVVTASSTILRKDPWRAAAHGPVRNSGDTITIVKVAYNSTEKESWGGTAAGNWVHLGRVAFPGKVQDYIVSFEPETIARKAPGRSMPHGPVRETGRRIAGVGLVLNTDNDLWVPTASTNFFLETRLRPADVPPPPPSGTGKWFDAGIWNLGNSNATGIANWVNRRVDVIKILDDMDCDIYCLQEIGNADMQRYIRIKLEARGMRLVDEITPQGMRFVIREDRDIEFVEGDEWVYEASYAGVGRKGCRAVFSVRGSDAVVSSVHLDARNEPTRVEQARELVQKVEELGLSQGRTFLMGDFNGQAGSLLDKVLNDAGYLDVSNRAGNRINAQYKSLTHWRTPVLGARIDQIRTGILRPVSKFEQILQTGKSDHLPSKARIERI